MARSGKRRQRTISGVDAVEVPSTSRPRKPTAKAITKRELATVDPGTPAREAAPGRKPSLERRSKVVSRTGVEKKKATPKRAGKRAPRQARAQLAAEQRAKTPSRRAGNRQSDPSAKTVPVTRGHKGRTRSSRPT